jgi:hypothetical protein
MRSSQASLTLADLTDEIDLGKNSERPAITKDERRVRVQRRETNLMDSLYKPSLLDVSPAAKMTFPKHLSQLLLAYFKRLHGEQQFSDVLFRLPLFTEPSLSIKDLLRSPFTFRDERLPSSMKADLDFIRRAIQLLIVEPLDAMRLKRFGNMSINALHAALNGGVHQDETLHDLANIVIKLGDLFRHSTRLDNARHLFLNYHLLLALTLTRGIEQLNARSAVNHQLVHSIGILMYSTRELIQDLGQNEPIVARRVIFEDLQQVVHASDRYALLRESGTLKVFLAMLHRWMVSSSPKKSSSSSIPDAPSLPNDLAPAEPLAADEMSHLDNPFDEKASRATTPKSSI